MLLLAISVSLLQSLLESPANINKKENCDVAENISSSNFNTYIHKYKIGKKLIEYYHSHIHIYTEEIWLKMLKYKVLLYVSLQILRK